TLCARLARERENVWPVRGVNVAPVPSFLRDAPCVPKHRIAAAIRLARSSEALANRTGVQCGACGNSRIEPRTWLPRPRRDSTDSRRERRSRPRRASALHRDDRTPVRVDRARRSQRKDAPARTPTAGETSAGREHERAAYSA